MNKNLKKFFAIICIIVMGFANTVQGYAVNSSQIKRKMDSMKEKKAKAESQVNSIQVQLNDLVASINQVEEALVTKGNEVIKSQKDLDRAEKKEKKQYKLMKKRIVYMYECGNKDLIGKLLESDSVADLLTKYEYIEKISDSDKKVFDDYVEIKEKVATVTNKLETEQKELETKEEEYQTKQTQLNDLLNSKQAEIGDLSIQLASANQEYAQAKAQEEAAAAAAAAEAARNSHNTTPTPSPGSGGGKTDDSKPQTVTGNVIVDRAYSKLGCPYVWGACGPYSFDCSGLVSYCLSGRYIRLGTSGAFGAMTRVSNPQPGDICCRIGHVGIYIGGGQMIHAPDSGDVVKVARVQPGMWYTRY